MNILWWLLITTSQLFIKYSINSEAAVKDKITIYKKKTISKDFALKRLILIIPYDREGVEKFSTY